MFNSVDSFFGIFLWTSLLYCMSTNVHVLNLNWMPICCVINWFKGLSNCVTKSSSKDYCLLIWYDLLDSLSACSWEVTIRKQEQTRWATTQHIEPKAQDVGRRMLPITHPTFTGVILNKVAWRFLPFDWTLFRQASS